ncbi:MAG: leucine-rich repeat domain-containing protein [Prevotellaceae bacterium]|jgi:hypothetical protein|nr:leucine-rich repeat domain-containing protein [Prevotellaceae bacterium]
MNQTFRKTTMMLAAGVLLGIGATAQTTTVASGTTGSCTWALTSDSTLTIGGAGAMESYDYYGIFAPWSPYQSHIKAAVVGDGVTAIGDYAFDGCLWMTSVALGSSVASIGEGAFSFCRGLTSVAIPASVTSIGYDAFVSCDGLTSVVIPRGVTAIGEGAFGGCAALTDIAVEGGSAGYVSEGGVLLSIDKATLLAYPAGRPGSSYAIPSSVTRISAVAFYRCSGLTAVTIPDGLTAIGEMAFYECHGLTSVAIPNSVDSIGMFAFSDCFGLTTVALGSGATSIGAFAFADCGALTSITNLCPVPQAIEAYMFDGTSKSACTLYVPKGSVAAYQAATGWKDFLHIEGVGDEPEPTPPCCTAVEALRAASLQTYPNPTAGLVYIDNPDGAEVEVYTLGGALLLRSRAAAVDLGQHAAGAYIIKVGSKVAKVVKQ